MMQFDYPDANVHAADRSTTTTPIQKLWMMNNPFVIEQAKQLARLLKSFDRSTARNIRNAYERLYGREPTSGELQLGISFLSDTDDSPADMTVWEQYAQILMTANEFLYVD
jgi:hypothetical protein